MLVMGYEVLMPVLVILVIVFYISIGKLWIIFISVVATLVIVAGE